MNILSYSFYNNKTVLLHEDKKLIGKTIYDDFIIKNETFIAIDLIKSRLSFFLDKKCIKIYTIAYGHQETPSPIGIWKIVYKSKDWGDGFGSRWMGLDVLWGLYGIHGTNNPKSIGYSISHGCIRMKNEDIEELFDLVPYNTLVIITGGSYGNLGNAFRTLIPGDRNSHVVEVQKRLKNLGYYTGSIDGIYGESLKKAIIQFKADNHLLISDVVDDESYKKLGIILFE